MERDYNYKKIFIDGNRGLGDLIILTPALKQLKKNYPHCELTLGSYEQDSLQLVQRLPYIDHLVHMRMHGLWNKICTAFSLKKYDYVIIPVYEPALAWLARKMGVKYLAGIGKEKHRSQNLFDVLLPYEDEMRLMMTVQYENLFKGLQLSCEHADLYRECDCSLPDEYEMNSAQSKMRDQGWKGQKFVALAPEAVSSFNIPYDFVLKSVEYIQSSYQMPCVLLGRTTKGMAERLVSDLKLSETALIDLSGQTSLWEMVAVFALSQMAITVDSGTMHIATALKKPTVAYFTSDRPERWASPDYCHPVSARVDCSPCQKRGSCENHICVDRITWEMFQTRIDEALT